MYSRKMPALDLLVTEPAYEPGVDPTPYPELQDMADKAEQSFWTRNELDFSEDTRDWNNRMTDDQRAFVSHALAFFAASESRVIQNLAQRFLTDTKIPEARVFYGLQIGIETIHEQTYRQIIETLIRDANERRRLFKAVESIPTIAAKDAWASKWLAADDATYGERVVAFAAVEGIFFSASFLTIYYVKSHLRILPGVCQSNDLISRDEGLHCKFAVLLMNLGLVNVPSEERTQAMIREAAEIEMDYVRAGLRCDLIGLNASTVVEYVKYVADRLLKQMQCAPIYNVDTCPVGFMTWIGLQSKTNFFEKRVSDYQLAPSDDMFNDDASF
jgi:ribonucleoside-diphosphate reductase subunit M2